MLNFDQEKLKDTNTQVSDKLYLISRYMEEKYGFVVQPNHWDDVFESMDKEDSIFYRIWLWMGYAEWETLLKPISGFEEVFGAEKRMKLLTYLENKDSASADLETYYSFDGEAGKILLNWGLENLKTTYNK